MGFWGGAWEVTKFAGKVAAIGTAGAVIVATGGAAAPLIGAGVYASGKIVKKIGEECDCEFIENLGDFTEDVGIDALTGGLVNFGTQTAGHLAAREIAKNGRRMTTGARILIKTGQTIKIGGKLYTFYEETKEQIECIARIYHGDHKGDGINYDSNCPICKGVF
jgi:hypothetical protein